MRSSLQQYDFLWDRIRLARQADKRPVVVVEGPTDKRFIERGLSNASDLALYVGGTRSQVIQTVRHLLEFEMTLFAGVVDRDFDDQVATEQARGVPLIAYDNADLE